MATPPPHGNPRNLSPKTHGDHHHYGNPPPSPPWTHIWPIIKTPPPSTTTTATPNSTTMNPQKKSIPKSNQTNSKFWIQKMTHKKKKIQVKIYTNPTTNRSRHYKPHQKPMNMPLQTTIPRRRIPMNPENVPKNTQKSPPYHADLTSPVSPPHRTTKSGSATIQPPKTQLKKLQAGGDPLRWTILISLILVLRGVFQSWRTGLELVVRERCDEREMPLWREEWDEKQTRA